MPTVTIASFGVDSKNMASPTGGYSMIAQVAVKNPNFYRVTLSEVKVDAYIDSDQRAAVAVGKTNDVKIAKGDNSFSIPFNVPAPAAGMPSLITTCTNNPAANVALLLRVTLDLALLHWTGKTFSRDINYNFSCAAAIAQLMPMIQKK